MSKAKPLPLRHDAQIASSQPAAPGLPRRLGAILYDGLLLLAIEFVFTLALLPFNQGEAFRPNQYAYPLYLTAVAFLFFGWFWTHGGQTLGMRAWKIRLRSEADFPVDWLTAAIRFAGAVVSLSALGAGFLWCLLDRQGRCWHDRLSRTYLERTG